MYRNGNNMPPAELVAVGFYVYNSMIPCSSAALTMSAGHSEEDRKSVV